MDQNLAKKRIMGQPKTSKFIDFIIGACIGLVVFILVYGISTLNVQYDGWIFAGYMEEDVMQRYAGWLFFRNSPWEWPITLTNNISIPEGGSIVFTDSIPLLAVFFKIFQPVLPQVFQYFGWYNLFNFILQGGFAFLLIRHFQVNRLFTSFACILFVTAPIFLERSFRHDSLASQWMILLALLLYFNARHSTAFPFISFAFLAIISPTLHFYFTPMIFAILFIALLERAIKEKKFLKYGLYLLLTAALTLAVMYIFGFFTIAGGATNEYGIFSMNLNALINPASRDFYAAPAYFQWSNFIPSLSQLPTQYDGFNYLGIGIIASFVAILLVLLYKQIRALACKDKAYIQKVKSFFNSHIFLLVLCLLLSGFAVSNIVALGDTVLLKIPLPNLILGLFSIFRSSGRMFWPITYLIYLSVILSIYKLLKNHWKTVAIIALVILQLADISGALCKKYEYFSGPNIVVNDEFSTEEWMFLAENYDNFYMMGNIFSGGLSLGIIRYNPDAKTNMIITNRAPSDAILNSYASMFEHLQSGQPLADGDLYICSDEETFLRMLSGLHKDARGYNTGHFYMVGNPIPGCPLQEYLPIISTPS